MQNKGKRMTLVMGSPLQKSEGLHLVNEDELSRWSTENVL